MVRPIDESHFIVRMVECKACGDRALVVFTEQVDWKHGDDPQCWHLVPLTRAEAEYAIGQDAQQVLAIAGEICRNRRQLIVDMKDSNNV